MVQEVIFARKVKDTAHPQLVFNNNPEHENSAQKEYWNVSRFQDKFSRTF